MQKTFIYKKIAGKRLIVMLGIMVTQLNLPAQTQSGLARSGVNQSPDQVLVAKFEQVCRQFSNFKGNYTLAGIINISGVALPMKNIPFRFCKQGKEFYYLLGKTITLNESGCNLYIDRQSKSILVSRQKEIRYQENAMSQFGKLAEKISSENYTISNRITGSQQTISLVNEHHVSCKEYTVTFNKATLKISRLYMRLSSLDAPGTTAGRDKIVDVAVTEWSHTANLRSYLSVAKVAVLQNGNWIARNEFKNYHVVQM
jgi:hypothetical protein